MEASSLLEGLFVAAANLNAKCEATCSMLGRGHYPVDDNAPFLVGQERYRYSSDLILLVWNYPHFQPISLPGTGIKIHCSLIQIADINFLAPTSISR